MLEFPKLSETFIVDELLALEARGAAPAILVRDRVVEDVSNPRASTLASRATFLRERPHRRRAAARVAIRHPIRLARCLWVAFRSLSRWSFQNLWFGLLVASEVGEQRLGYLHAHFAHDAAEMAYFASTLTGTPYGVTAHAVDIYLGRFLCRKLAQARVLVTVCRYNVDQIRERCPRLRADEFLIKYAGVDTARFRLRAPRPLRPGRVVVAVGRLTPKKGFDLLIRAAAALVAEGVDLTVRIVGGGDREGELRSLIDELGVGGVVRLSGPCAPDQLEELLYEADVLAAPCTVTPWGDRDSMPVVIKEAMAMELPVVATNDFGIPELVHADAGLLFARDDVGDLARSLRTVLQLPPDERARMGRAGRAIIESRFEEGMGAAVLLEAIEGVLGAHAA